MDIGGEGKATKGIGRGPKARVCYICGRQYMLHSFDIHIAQCKELYEKREALKPVKERKPCPNDPLIGLSNNFGVGTNNFDGNSTGNSTNSTIKSGGMNLTGGGGIDMSKMTHEELDALNNQSTEAWNSAVLAKCEFCGRTFLPEKLAIHNRSCTAENPSRRVGTASLSKRDANGSRISETSSSSSVSRPGRESREARMSSQSATVRTSFQPPNEIGASLSNNRQNLGATRTSGTCGAGSEGRVVTAREKELLERIHQLEMENAVLRGDTSFAPTAEKCLNNRNTKGYGDGEPNNSKYQSGSNGDIVFDDDYQETSNTVSHAAKNRPSSGRRPRSGASSGTGSILNQSIPGTDNNRIKLSGGPPPMESFGDDSLQKCPHCDRSFTERAYTIHVNLCQKVFQKKRKPFDSKKHRILGTDAAEYVAKNKTDKNKTSGSATPAGDTKKWKQQSNQFREAMKLARMVAKDEQNMKLGLPSTYVPSAPVPCEPDPSFIQCPHCMRTYNEKAAERHIPKCKDIINKPTVLKKGKGSAMCSPIRR